MSIITTLDQVTEYPLVWPDAKPRSAHRSRSRFGANSTIAKAVRNIEYEMERWKVGNAWTLSRMPPYRRSRVDDPAVALWFLMPLKPNAPRRELRVIACDTFDLQEHNAWAIYQTLDALRAIERWGAYSLEQAVEGARPALPPPDDMRTIDWRTLLGLSGIAVTSLPNNLQLDLVNSAYRRAAAEAGNDESALRQINLARDAAKLELSGGA